MTDDGRWPLSRFLLVGVTIAIAACLPLQLYIIFGPSDGNPIGLGLLAAMGILLGLTVFVTGLIKCLIRYFME